MIQYRRLDRHTGRAFIFSGANALREQVNPCCLSKQQQRFTGGFVMKVKRICEQCGTEFFTFPSETKKGWGRFCSQDCHYQSMYEAHPTTHDLKNLSAQEIVDKYDVSIRTAYRYKEPFREIQARQLKFCPNCGKEIELRVDFCRECYVNRGITKKYCARCGTEVIPRKNARYCHKCYGKYRSRTFVGPNSPLWRGGSTPYPPEFSKKRKRKIKNRDNYQCQLCGVAQETLCVHHIDYNKQNSKEYNLISLCRSCHGQTSVTNRTFWTSLLQLYMRTRRAKGDFLG